TGTATITITADTLYEGDESVILTMGTPTYATLGATTVHTATITDDDAAPAVQWTSASQASVYESGTMTVTAQLSGASAFAVTVPFAVTGTATDGTDYTITASPITIPAGSTTGTATITIINDTLAEGSETVILTMGTPTNAAPGTTTVHTATIMEDDGFNPNANNAVYAIAVQGDGKILIGGGFTTIGGTTRNRIARLNTDGSLDTSFNPNANSGIWSIAVQGDGKILIGGGFTTIGGTTRNRIARLNANGSLDTSFNPNANSNVNAIAVQTDGKILIGGDFTNVGGTARNYIARLNATGGLDTSFNPNADSWVYSIALQADGMILIGGQFTTIGGTARNYIARLNATGGLDTLFDPDADSWVYSIALQADGMILVGGQFTSIGAIPVNCIARLNTDGSVDTSFDPIADSDVYSIAVRADGMILLGGQFTSIDWETRNYIALLNADGSLDTSFNNPVPNGSVLSVALQADGKILVGGAFTNISGTARNYMARFANTEAALQTLTSAEDGSSLTWMRSGTSPEIERVAFEKSDDMSIWTSLGSGTRISEGWQLTGLSLPLNQIFYIRALGYSSDGISTSLMEFVQIFNIGGSLPSVQWTSSGQSSANESGTMTVTAQLSEASGLTVTVPFTVTGTATNGTDYTITASPITIPAGSTTGTATITITNDTAVEVNETVILTMGTPTNVTLGSTTVHTATITDDDGPPTVQFQSASSSGSEAITPAAIAVTLSSASGNTVTVNYATADGTATADSDYTAVSGTLTFNPGDMSKTINVPIINDTAVEGNENFTVTLSSPSNATIGTPATHTYTINDNDSYGSIQLSSATYSVTENIGTVTIIATRSGGSSGAVGISYETSDETAEAGFDYTSASGTLSWADGDSSNKTFTVDIINDTLLEVDETFTVTLSSPTGGASSGSPVSTTVTITDEDVLIMDLVTWYYESILNRLPEPGGAEGWTAEIQRIDALGIDIKEGFIALGKLFFNSAEYINMNTTDDEYITDLYETFLGRTPSQSEVDYWAGELSGGLTRNLLMNYFIFSQEFMQYMTDYFGDTSVRPEYNLVNDLFRGFLSRLPDDGGFNYWLAQMQTAQCNGNAQEIRDLILQMALLFLNSQEYANRNTSNSEYIEDLYNGILRRGAELSGYLFWLEQLNNGTYTRETLLTAFVNSTEFQTRVQQVIDAGCAY
ncbi:MAG: DUF4214 domain-containing protein, partial [Nitrospirae bacterium]|nr:DUF4214 domain-containing protein [Nitrospirota bacterium]